MAGKSTLARRLKNRGYVVRCGDPRSTVREPESDVTYLPEGLDWSGASSYVADHWLATPGRWIAEGHIMARALRKQLDRGGVTVDQILVLPEPHPAAYLTAAQRPLAASVMRTWREIEPQLRAIARDVRFSAEPQWSPLDGVQALAAQLDQLRP